MKKMMTLMVALLATASSFAAHGKVQQVYIRSSNNSVLVKIKDANHMRGYLSIGSGDLTDPYVKGMMDILLSAQAKNITVEYEEKPSGYYNMMDFVSTNTDRP